MRVFIMKESRTSGGGREGDAPVEDRRLHPAFFYQKENKTGPGLALELPDVWAHNLCIPSM